tara:strand:+ start:57169 stop:58422 length:1254 start_codon:yes stop_codon:yes gene_type:complete
MPSMGADMTEGTVVKWLKSEGDTVQRGDKIAEIETDKTIVEMEVYTEGTLRKIIVDSGTKVPVGELIAFIGDPSDDLPEVGINNESDQQTPIHSDDSSNITNPPENDLNNSVDLNESDSQTPTKLDSDSSLIKASPMAKRLAKERGIDISQILGSGPGGRITKNDILNYSSPNISEGLTLKNKNISLNSKNTDLSKMRQAIARVTVKSKTEIPHYYVTHEVDMTNAMSFRKQFNDIISKDGDKISVNDLIIKALVNSLIKYPKWNSYFAVDHLKANSDINIGIAIALQEGLIVPAIQKCQNLSLVEISRSSKDIGNRAKGEGGTLTQEELSNGTFGTSNLGMFGTEVFAAIIVPPQSGILAVGAVKDKPVVIDGKIVIRSIMNATLSADHRVGDGAEAAILLKEIQRNLENPLHLLK